MLYTLTYSKNRQPYIENGRAVERQVGADSRTAAIYHADTVKYCTENGLTVRSVSP